MKKILIVDDSSIIRKVIEKNLSEYEIEIVGGAGDGLTALEMFNKYKPDIVTLDITMPEMDGLTVLEKMLNIKPDTKIIVITALTDKSTGIRAIKMGAKSFVGKPFTAALLKATFEKQLSE